MVEQSEGRNFPPKMSEFADFTPPNAAPETLTFRDSGEGPPFALERQTLFDQYGFRPPQPPTPLPPAAHRPIAQMTYESTRLPRPKTDGSEGKDSAGKKKKQCSCKHSRCLKLYCECFAAGIYCDGCKCVNCQNNDANEKPRQKAIEATLIRNPQAFKSKIACSPDAVQDNKKSGLHQKVRDVVVIEKHSKGCHCKKSGCLKKYCECFQADILCSDLCKCVDCKNKEDSEERRALSRRDNVSNTANMQQAANDAISGAIGSSGPPLSKKRKAQEHLFGSTVNVPPVIPGCFQKPNRLPSSASTISGTRHSKSSGMGASKFAYRSLLADIIGPQDLKDLCSELVVYSSEAAKKLADERSDSGRPTGESRENHLASPEGELRNQKVSSVAEKASLNGHLNVIQSDDMTPEELDSDGVDVSKGRPLSPATLALMCDEQDTMFTKFASPTGVSDQSSQLPSAEGLSEVFSEQERMVLTKFRDCLSKLITLGEIKEMKCSSFAISESGNPRNAMSNTNASDLINALNQQQPSSMSNLAKSNVGVRQYGSKKLSGQASGARSDAEATVQAAVAPSVGAASDALADTRSATGDKRGRDPSEFVAVGKRLKLAPVGGALANEKVEEGSLAYLLRDASFEEVMLSVSDVLRYAAGCAVENHEALKKKHDDALKAAIAEGEKKATLLEKELRKAQATLKSLRKGGALSPDYPALVVSRVMKTQAFERMAVAIVDKARILGQSEGLKAQLEANPALSEHGFPSMEDLEGAIAEDKEALKLAFEDAVRDGGFKFEFLEHLRRVPYLPDVKRLKALDVDYNSDLPEEMRPSPSRRVVEEQPKKPVVEAETGAETPPAADVSVPL